MTIGHLDSGIQATLAAFTGRVAAFKDFIDDSPELIDRKGHGTATAGLLLKEAPKAQLWVGRCTTQGHDISRLLAGMDWLSQSPVRVICMPIGLQGRQSIFQSMINHLETLGKLMVVPIGNRYCHSPGIYPNVLSVGAADARGNPARFSPHHVIKGIRQKPDILAPGVHVKTLSLSGEAVHLNGTSYACALASAHVAKLFEAFPDTSPRHMIRAVTESGDHRHRSRANGGNIQPEEAMKWLAQNPDPKEPLKLPELVPFSDPYLKVLIKEDQPELSCVLVAKEPLTEHEVKAIIANNDLLNFQVLSDQRTVLLEGSQPMITQLINSDWVCQSSASQPEIQTGFIPNFTTFQ